MVKEYSTPGPILAYPLSAAIFRNRSANQRKTGETTLFRFKAQSEFSVFICSRSKTTRRERHKTLHPAHPTALDAGVQGLGDCSRQGKALEI